jgi:hypothetical protein
MDEVFDDKLFELTCHGAKRIGEFLEATRGAQFDESVSRLREQAKIALSAIVTSILSRAGKYYLSHEDLKDLMRFTEQEFLEDK